MYCWNDLKIRSQLSTGSEAGCFTKRSACVQVTPAGWNLKIQTQMKGGMPRLGKLPGS